MPETDTPPSGNDYAEIGRMPVLRKEIDQKHNDVDNISATLEKRMGVIDLIPCNFSMFEGLGLDNLSMTNILDKAKPTILYQEALKQFKDMQVSYGLAEKDKGKEFLRVYLTDSTTVQETVSNSYTKNIIDDTLNSVNSSRIGQLFKKIQDFSSSLGTDKKGVNKDNHIKTDTKYMEISKTAEVVNDVLTHGSRISFPKIWAGTDYNPALTCNVKLVSPYGHPEAIAKFIIRPLGLLMLLLAPKTISGLITTRPSLISMKAYGMASLRICSPSVLEIRRGGDDSSYNEYRQPLTVDIAITFDSISEGFAAFNKSDDNPEKSIFSLTDGTLTRSFEKEFEVSPDALFSTMRTLVNSFRPFKYDSSSPELTAPFSSQRQQTTTIFGSGKETISKLPDDSFPTDSTTIDETDDMILAPIIVDTSTNNSITLQPYDITANFDVLLIMDNDTIIERVNPNNFNTPTDLINSITSTSTTHEVEFTPSALQGVDSYVVKIRTIRTDSLPGIWSEIKCVTLDESLNFSVDIIPQSLVINNNLRWTVEDANNVIYGPYLYNCHLEYGDYTLRVINDSSEVEKEESITFSIENNYYEIFFNVDLKSITITPSALTDCQTEDFKYFLISDVDESMFESNTGFFEEIPVGVYSLLIKYQNTDVPYAEGSYASINIISITNILVTINEQFEIILIEVS